MIPAIRKATAGDLDAMHLIESEGQARWTRRQFEDELGLSFSDMWVIDDGGAVTAFAVTWTVADEIQLNNIGVRRGLRRRGLASMLMDHIIRTARGRGGTRLRACSTGPTGSPRAGDGSGTTTGSMLY